MSREPRMRDRGNAYGAVPTASRSRSNINSQPYPVAHSRALSDRGEGVPSRELVVANSQPSPSQLFTSQNPTPAGPPRLTIHNFAIFNARAKKLPPDANIKAALHTKLWQFPERVCFACAKCRRDNVQSDSVAIDPQSRVILCTACFTRIIRPRIYRPSRVVPFPSLLSWLNYKPAQAMNVDEDVMERPAEAVAPSGQRMAVPLMAGGDRPTQLHRLPANAMNVVPHTGGGAGSHYANRGRGGGGSNFVAHRNGAGGVGGRSANMNAHHNNMANPNHSGKSGGATMDMNGERRHPCIRVWGRCVHGETCLFRNAPFDLCLAYLMGICRPHDSRQQQQQQTKAPLNTQAMRQGGRYGGRGGRGRGPCRLLHQNIYDLPPVNDPVPLVRHASHMVDDDSIWARWIQRQRGSPNSAAWQLWNNGPCEGLLNAFVPLTPETQSKEGGATTAAVAEEEDPETNDTAESYGAPDASDEIVGGENNLTNAVEGGYDEEQSNQPETLADANEQQQMEEEEQQQRGGSEDAHSAQPDAVETLGEDSWSGTTTLNFADIMSALQQIKKTQDTDCDTDTTDNHDGDEEETQETEDMI